jgi:hypothetical protein
MEERSPQRRKERRDTIFSFAVEWPANEKMIAKRLENFLFFALSAKSKKYFSASSVPLAKSRSPAGQAGGELYHLIGIYLRQENDFRKNR